MLLWSRLDSYSWTGRALLFPHDLTSIYLCRGPFRCWLFRPLSRTSAEPRSCFGIVYPISNTSQGRGLNCRRIRLDAVKIPVEGQTRPTIRLETDLMDRVVPSKVSKRTLIAYVDGTPKRPRVRGIEKRSRPKDAPQGLEAPGRAGSGFTAITNDRNVVS